MKPKAHHIEAKDSHNHPSPLIEPSRFDKVNATLLEVSNAVSSTPELHDLYRSIHLALSNIIDASNFFIAIHHQATDSLEFPYHIDEVDAQYPNVLNVSKTASLTAEVIRTGKPLMIDKEGILRLRSESGYSRPACTVSEIWLGVPLKVKNEIIGVMAVQSYTDPQRYQPEDLDLLVLVAGQVATAIEYKRAEEALRDSEERYRHLFENMNDAIFVADSQAHIVDVNEAACRSLGYCRDDLLNMTIEDVDPNTSNTRFVQDIEKSDYESPRIVESMHLRKDGTTFPVEINTVSYVQNSKKQIVGVARDVTERKRAEEIVRNSAERLNAFFGSINDAIFVHPLLEEGFGPFIEVNRIACERYGYTREEFLQLTVMDITKTDDAKSHGRADHRQKLLKKKQLIFETTHITKNGDQFPVEINSNIIVQYGKPVILAVVRDISERKQAQEEREQLEQQLLQAQKMESIGRLAGGIAHDFNNMLGIILGHTEILLDELEDNDFARQDLLKIEQSANHSVELVRQLLAFARKQPVSLRVLDVNKEIDNMLEMLIRLIGEDITLDWLPADTLWLTRIDPMQLQQIITNLCINARDAITSQGTITITTRNTSFPKLDLPQLYKQPEGDFVNIIVEDNGHGISEEEKERIFEPFYTTKVVGKGTGLGLATVYGIVKQNQGFIKVDSEPGIGSTFLIYLPRHRKEPSYSAAPAPSLSGKTWKGTILVVEDEKALLKICRNMLEKSGYHVLTADNPRAAIALANDYAGTIDLLLTDIIMPEMNGRELAEKIAESHPHVRSLYMSGYPAETIANRGDLDNDISFLQKPFKKDSLIAHINACMCDKA